MHLRLFLYVNKKTPANYKPNTDCLMGRKNYGASDGITITIPNVRPRDNTMINNGINHQRMMHNANYQQQQHQMQYQSMQLQQRQHVNSQQSQRYQQQFYNQ